MCSLGKCTPAAKPSNLLAQSPQMQTRTSSLAKAQDTNMLSWAIPLLFRQAVSLACATRRQDPNKGSPSQRGMLCSWLVFHSSSCKRIWLSRAGKGERADARLRQRTVGKWPSCRRKARRLRLLCKPSTQSKFPGCIEHKSCCWRLCVVCQRERTRPSTSTCPNPKSLVQKILESQWGNGANWLPK